HKIAFHLILFMNFPYSPAAVERRKARRRASFADDLRRSGDRPHRETGHGHGVPCQRLSALRSPRSFGEQKQKTATPAPPRIGAAKLVQISKKNLVGWANARAETLTRYAGQCAFAHAAQNQRTRKSESARRGQRRARPCPIATSEQRLCPPY